MKADITWLDNPEIFEVNRLPAHSDHAFFADREEARTGNSSLVQPLNGAWRFCYAPNAAKRPADFYREDFDASGFTAITVPGHIELAGFDKIHYINTMYPWEGHTFRRPAYTLDGGMRRGMFSEADYNPVGSYLTSFDLQEELCQKRVCICFEGVEQAFYVWLNGEFVGYAEDSFTPSEFDLTPYIREKGNLLAVEVHKRSTAAFLEDQDFFRFFGIFRNVTLYAKPKTHLEDLWIRPVLNADNQSGRLSIDMKLSGELPGELSRKLQEARGGALRGEQAGERQGTRPDEVSGGSVRVTLQDSRGDICLQRSLALQNQVALEEGMPEVTPWDNHKPYLYELTVELLDADGAVIEITPYRIGFRRIEIQDKVMLLNGKRLILNGVNRHEWSAAGGRCIGMDEMREDIRIFADNHINAVRTCHYPDMIPWYYLCDENGLYVMAETNLESHGSWQKAGAVEPSWNVPGSVPQWREAVMDRARTNFEVFKNHTSILFWSLGNESYAGDDMESMNRFFKEKDPDRLVHYEGIFHNRAYHDSISDVESRMYATPQEVREYLEHEPEKPFIMCEYMHDMGNSMGGMGSYMKLLEEYEMYQGGFIWDYIDQALWVKDEVTGEKVFRYGGDFDDRPSDYEFSGNGIVFADRSVKPAMQEVRYYYGLYK